MASTSSSSPSIGVETKVVAAPPLITLKGKVAIITGGSRGIGQGAALALARDGAKVVINYNQDKTGADATVAALNTIAPNTAIAIQGDVSKSADVDRLFAQAKAHYGRIDIVFANSGVSAGGTPIATTTQEEYDRILGPNLNGVFYTLRAAANTIEDNGRIIVNGSITKTGHAIGVGVYAAGKAAIEVLANTLAQEVGSRGITVNTIHPGGTETKTMRSFVAGSPEALEWVRNLSPQKRIGTIMDLGDAVALIASESARWISGQAINVSGGGYI